MLQKFSFTEQLLRSKKMDRIVTPEEFLDHINYKKKFPNFICPDTCIIAFGGEFIHLLKETFDANEKGPLGLKLFELNNRPYAIFKANIGETAASINLEELKALGFKNIIAIGSAGGLQPSALKLKVGDILVGSKAVCDEGLSRQYMKNPPEVFSNSGNLISEFTRLYPQIPEVTSWTTNAPFLENRQKFQKYTKMGASVVEMELSSLLCVSSCLNMDMLNLFVVSDILTESKWMPSFTSPELKRGSIELVQLLKKYLEKTYSK